MRESASRTNHRTVPNSGSLSAADLKLDPMVSAPGRALTSSGAGLCASLSRSVPLSVPLCVIFLSFGLIIKCIEDQNAIQANTSLHSDSDRSRLARRAPAMSSPTRRLSACSVTSAYSSGVS